MSSLVLDARVSHNSGGEGDRRRRLLAGKDDEMDREERDSGRVTTVDADEAFRSYERGLVTLARLGELLGMDRQDAIEFVESRGAVVRDGPESVEEALEDMRTLRDIASR
jgi:hypothetical protein